MKTGRTREEDQDSDIQKQNQDCENWVSVQTKDSCSAAFIVLSTGS